MLVTVTVRVAIFLPSHIDRSFLRLNQNSALAYYQRALLPHNADRSTHLLSPTLPFTHATVITWAVCGPEAPAVGDTAPPDLFVTLCAAPPARRPCGQPGQVVS